MCVCLQVWETVEKKILKKGEKSPNLTSTLDIKTKTEVGVVFKDIFKG